MYSTLSLETRIRNKWIRNQTATMKAELTLIQNNKNEKWKDLKSRLIT